MHKFDLERFMAGEIAVNELGREFKFSRLEKELACPVVAQSLTDSSDFNTYTTAGQFLSWEEPTDCDLYMKTPQISLTKEDLQKYGGVKHDSGKERPTLILKDLQNSFASVLEVLEFGAKKYSRMGYATVENHRYQDALLRHVMAHLRGEEKDSESGYPHLAHAACCVMFLLESQLKGLKDE